MPAGHDSHMFVTAFNLYPAVLQTQESFDGAWAELLGQAVHLSAPAIENSFAAQGRHLFPFVLVPAGQVETQLLVTVLNLFPEVGHTQESFDEVTCKLFRQGSHVLASFKYVPTGHCSHFVVTVLNLYPGVVQTQEFFNALISKPAVAHEKQVDLDEEPAFENSFAPQGRHVILST